MVLTVLPRSSKKFPLITSGLANPSAIYRLSENSRRPRITSWSRTGLSLRLPSLSLISFKAASTLAGSGEAPVRKWGSLAMRKNEAATSCWASIVSLKGRPLSWIATCSANLSCSWKNAGRSRFLTILLERPSKKAARALSSSSGLSPSVLSSSFSISLVYDCTSLKMFLSERSSSHMAFSD